LPCYPYKRHTRWSESGVSKKVFEHLADDADREYAMIDATIVRAHQHSAGAKGGPEAAMKRSQGGLATKIQATCNALGNPTSFHLTPGQAHDLQGADTLMHDLKARTVIADKAYDAHERAIDPLQRADKHIVIPPESNRTTKRIYDADLYKACTSLKTSSPNSGNTALSPAAMINVPETSAAQSTSPSQSYGLTDDPP
jgi:transposase